MSDTSIDPLRERVTKSIRFRPDDPPEVRETMIQIRMAEESAAGMRIERAWEKHAARNKN